MQLRWSDLFAYGIIVHPVVRRPGLRTPRRLSDFGLKEDAVVEKSGTEGHWKFIPQKALKKIDKIGREVRELVDSYSVPFPLVPGGMFVPNTSFKSLIDELTLLRKEYRDEVNTLILDYEKLIQEQCPAIKAYIKRINPRMDPEVTIQRVLSYVPPTEKLKKKFDISWSVFAVQAPINKAVAEIVEKEEESVRKIIIELIEKVKEPIIEEIDRLLKLIETERSSTFSMKSINVGLNACSRFENKNVFQDPFIKKSISLLRSLLEKMKKEREGGISNKTIDALKDIQSGLINSDSNKQAKQAFKFLGKFVDRKIN